MCNTSLQDQIDDATLDFTLGESAAAIEKLTALVKSHPQSFEAWHALTEVYFSEADYKRALEAGEAAHVLKPDDIHINTSLSRIWMERGDKPKAEHFGAQARMLGWKDELRSPPEKGNIS
ncbi:MAG: tetratricopeptide repeat protein [Lentimonas sp.]